MLYYPDLSFKIQALTLLASGNAVCWRLIAEILWRHCLFPKEAVFLSIIPSPQEQARSKIGQYEIQRFVSFFNSGQLKKAISAQNSIRLLKFCSYHITSLTAPLSLLLPWLPHLSMLRTLLNKHVTCKVLLQSLCPRKLHGRHNKRCSGEV